MWQIKIPRRIIFLWYLKKGVALTKDNLLDEIGTTIRGAAYVTQQKVFNISFSIVYMPNSCGALSI
jgi:hypothetical protein